MPFEFRVKAYVRNTETDPGRIQPFDRLLIAPSFNLSLLQPLPLNGEHSYFTFFSSSSAGIHCFAAMDVVGYDFHPRVYHSRRREPGTTPLTTVPPCFCPCPALQVVTPASHPHWQTQSSGLKCRKDCGYARVFFRTDSARA